jgi:hypothetical protein
MDRRAMGEPARGAREKLTAGAMGQMHTEAGTQPYFIP